MTNYDELVKRLRATAQTMNGAAVGAGDGNTCVPGPYGRGNQELDKEAADAITRLQAELKEALEALKVAKEVIDVAEALTSCKSDDEFVWNAQKAVNAIIAKHEGEKG